MDQIITRFCTEFRIRSAHRTKHRGAPYAGDYYWLTAFSAMIGSRFRRCARPARCALTEFIILLTSISSGV